jgi:hypothetical protein
VAHGEGDFAAQVEGSIVESSISSIGNFRQIDEQCLGAWMSSTSDLLCYDFPRSPTWGSLLSKAPARRSGSLNAEAERRVPPLPPLGPRLLCAEEQWAQSPQGTHKYLLCCTCLSHQGRRSLRDGRQEGSVCECVLRKAAKQAT